MRVIAHDLDEAVPSRLLRSCDLQLAAVQIGDPLLDMRAAIPPVAGFDCVAPAAFAVWSDYVTVGSPAPGGAATRRLRRAK